MESWKKSVVAGRVFICALSLLMLTVVAACQSEPPTPPPLPAEPTSEIMQKCLAGLSENNMDAFSRDAQALGEKPGPRQYGALLRRYYSCEENEAFAVWWLSGSHTSDKLDMTASWGEFSAGWESQ